MNIIGAGNVGKTLAKLLHDKQLLTIQSICNQSLGSAQSACDFIRAGEPVSNLADMSSANITLIAVPDNAISTVCTTWLKECRPQPGSIVFHVSGALGAQALEGATEQGLFVASVHPLKSFASPKQAYSTFEGTFCGMEGDEQALAVLTPLFEGIGGKLGRIRSESKALYHAACVMACGGLTALYASCLQLLREAGLSDSQLGEYMKHTIDNNVLLGSRAALTGPVARGDNQTIEMHQRVLSGELRELYDVLTELQITLKNE